MRFRINPEINISEIVTVIMIFGAGVAGWNHHEARISANEKAIMTVEQKHTSDMVWLEKQRTEDKENTMAMFKRIDDSLVRIEGKLDGKAEKR